MHLCCDIWFDNNNDDIESHNIDCRSMPRDSSSDMPSSSRVNTSPIALIALVIFLTPCRMRRSDVVPSDRYHGRRRRRRSRRRDDCAPDDDASPLLSPPSSWVTTSPSTTTSYATDPRRRGYDRGRIALGDDRRDRHNADVVHCPADVGGKVPPPFPPSALPPPVVEA